MIWPYRKNFYILLIDAVAYATFCALWDVNTVIPVFLDQIDSPSWLVGAVSSLKQLGFLIPQLFVVGQLYKLNSLGGSISTIMFVDRLQLLIFPLLLLLTADRTVLLTVFLISFAILSFGEGTVVIPWMDLMGRTLRPETRGRFWGSIQVLGGIATLGAGFIISQLLNSPSLAFPRNFVVIFGIGALIVLPSIILFKTAEDPLLPFARVPAGWLNPVRRCLDNRQFVLLLAVQHLSGYDSLAIPYYIIMVRHKFQWLVGSTGTYVLLSIAGGILGGILWGILSNLGNSKIIKLIIFVKVVTAGIFLTSQLVDSRPALTFLLAAGFTLLGIVTAAWIGFFSCILNMAAHSERPFYIALSNAVFFPTAFLPIIGGLLREYSGDITLYIIATAAMTAAFVLSLRMRDPA